MNLRIKAQIELISPKRADENASEWSEVRSPRLNRSDPSLLVTFVAGEEKDSIFPNRPAHLITELAALKEWIRIVWIAAQSGICGEVMIAKKVEAAAVILIAARPRNDVDGAIRRHAG